MRGTAVPQGVSPLRDQSLVLGSHVGAATTRRPSRDAAGRRHPGTTAPACGSHVTRRLSTEKTLAVNDREQALQALDDSVIVGTDGEISTVGQVYTTTTWQPIFVIWFGPLTRAQRSQHRNAPW